MFKHTTAGSLSGTERKAAVRRPLLAFCGQSGVPPLEVSLPVTQFCPGDTSGAAVFRAQSGFDDLELLDDADPQVASAGAAVVGAVQRAGPAGVEVVIDGLVAFGVEAGRGGPERLVVEGQVEDARPGVAVVRLGEWAGQTCGVAGCHAVTLRLSCT